MKLTSTITEYDASWPRKYEVEAARLALVFASALVSTHHVGSTAVPKLAAKPEIDILIVVNDLSAAPDWTESLSSLGYVRGNDLSVGHLFFKRNDSGVRTHKLHVCLSHHIQVSQMLDFRDRLRRDGKLRDHYAALKLKLERTNTTGIGEYIDGKAPFINEVLASNSTKIDTPRRNQR